MNKLLEGFTFDQSFFKQVNNKRQFDEGSMVIFRAANGAGEEQFIHIFNTHNGYYGHGFKFQIGGNVLYEDTL